MHINKIGLFAAGLLLGNLALAHEGHQHEGIGDAETIKQAKEGKLCILKNQGHPLGAVIEQDKKIFRCVKAYSQDLIAQTELVWVEVALKDKGLSTLP
jgi:hypothetical protein